MIDAAYRILITVCFQQAEWKSQKGSIAHFDHSRILKKRCNVEHKKYTGCLKVMKECNLKIPKSAKCSCSNF